MKTYYNDTPRKVTFENKSIGLSDADDYFSALSDHKESYIGFIDVYDEVIIFKWLAHNKWLIDHPTVPGILHRQCYASSEECLVFIEKVYQEHDISNFEGFEDVPVQEFTLDEILEFKEEDEYLLREEEPPVKKVTPAKSIELKPKKKKKTSIILGDISVPKEQPRTKLTPRVTDKKKPKTTTSPLKQFKESAKQLKKEKKQLSIAKTSVKPVTKKVNKLKPIQNKTSNTSLLSLGETAKPKKVDTTILETTSKTTGKKTKPLQSLAKKAERKTSTKDATASKATIKKANPKQAITKKTNPKTPEKNPSTKPKTTKRKTLHQLDTQLSKDKKSTTNKTKPTTKTTKKDIQKPSDDSSFFSI
ncbi:hypothetical protein [Aquimarina sp. MMG016]|uniref:hypothetical protein n=1 Tax=Aquimarina sp. MMG016 TaxID=2822690 RepID=UPI001B39E0DB|nr:hypothetical protein [Aquimarina sp. MMG016]MBQ4820630.1 hypothetical protein [Aquimarina sp. MMG016]